LGRVYAKREGKKSETAFLIPELRLRLDRFIIQRRTESSGVIASAITEKNQRRGGSLINSVDPSVKSCLLGGHVAEISGLGYVSGMWAGDKLSHKLVLARREPEVRGYEEFLVGLRN
jgi:hypothetical protein